MILVDVTAIACLLLDNPRQAVARRAFSQVQEWVSAPIWRQQFIETLANRIRFRGLSVANAVEKLTAATFVIRNSAEHLDDADVLGPVDELKVSALHATLILVSRRLGAKVLAADDSFSQRFPADVMAIESITEE